MLKYIEEIINMNKNNNKISISVQLEKEQFEELKAAANKECRTIAAQVRLLILEYLRDGKKS